MNRKYSDKTFQNLHALPPRTAIGNYRSKPLDRLVPPIRNILSPNHVANQACKEFVNNDQK